MTATTRTRVRHLSAGSQQMLDQMSRDNGRGMCEDWDPACVQECLDCRLVETCRPCHQGSLRLTWAGWDAFGIKGM